MEQTYSVSELLSVINQTLDYAYPSVIVEGEVASFKINKDKYVFFDLKDEEGSISCFMMIYALKQPLEDGMKVRIEAQAKITAWGKFSLTVRSVMPVGEGNIKRAFELLKIKLEKDGLFDEGRKRPLPKTPVKVGLIASTQSAGYSDFIKILKNRWGGLDIRVANVQVQGVSADMQIIRAINYFNEVADIEVLVIVRGGGSADDLSVFNSENLVRAVAASRTPTLVGVGHEVDISLCDQVADVRASTPSNAAEILVPDRQEIIRHLKQSEKRFVASVIDKLRHLQTRVHESKNSMFTKLENAYNARVQRLKSAQLTLKQLDPTVVLNRGYAIARVNNVVLRGNAKNVKKGDNLEVKLSNAIIKAGVENVERF